MIQETAGDSTRWTAAIIDADTQVAIPQANVVKVWVSIGTLSFALTDDEVSLLDDEVVIVLTPEQTDDLSGKQKVHVKVELNDGKESTIVDGEFVKFNVTPLTTQH